MALSRERRFQYKIWPRGDCWEWRGSRDANGYGFFRDGREMRRAHRIAYEMAKGILLAWPMQLDHLCRHPWCVRPSHLEQVTHSQNVKRGELPRVMAAHNRRRALNGRGQL